MMRLPFSLLLLLISFVSFAQVGDTTAQKLAIDSVNRLLDHAVVAKNKAVMERHYAADFFFTHGTGQIDSKESWINTVMQRNNVFVSREHDSTFVELHGDVALVTGVLTVRRSNSGYALRYQRLYGWRQKRWQLLSHRTFQEWHL